MKKLAVLFVVAFLTVLAGAAPALAAPGMVTGLASAAYSTGAFSFSWNPVNGIAGYAYVFDQNPDTPAGSTVLVQTPSFSTSKIDLGTSCRQVATADFGNGQSDLAALCESTDQVKILLGDGTGTFTVGTTYATGSDPHSVVVGDFNGDGRPDLAVANWGDDTVGVYLANGVGTFAPPVSYATDGEPHGMAVADLGNGHLDVVIPDFASNTVSVLLGNGDGTFQPKFDYQAGLHPELVAVSDLDGNGKPDLAVINNGADTVSIFMGNGGGTLTSGGTYSTGTTPHWVAAGDLGNGNVDLAVANQADDTVSVLLGNGDGTFRAKVDYAVGAQPMCLAMVDVNADSILDLVVSDGSSDDVTVLLGKGGGTFLPAQFLPFSPAGLWPRFFAVGDFDGDGWPDLAVPFSTGTGIGVLHNTTGSAPSPVSEKATVDGTWYFHVAAVDVNGDAGPTSTRAVVRDTTPPVTTADAPSGWQSKSVTVTLSPADSGSGMSGGQAATNYELDSGPWTMGTSATVPAPVDHSGDGVHIVSYRSSDAAGNWEAVRSVPVRIDTTPPSGGFTLDGGAAMTTTRNVTVDSAVSDANGLSAMRFSTDGVAWGAWMPYSSTASLVVPWGRTATVWAQYQDSAGNVCESSATIALALPADTTSPSLTAFGVTPGAWLRHGVTITLTAADEAGGSGVAAITYSLDGTRHTATGASVTIDVPASPNAAHTLTCHATDAAANSGADQTVSFTIDTTGPVTAAKAASGRVAKSIALSYRAIDALSHRVYAPKVIVKNARGKVVKTFATSAATSRTSGAWYSVRWKPAAKGTYHYYVYAKDAAGNAQSKAGSAKVVVR